MKTEYVGTGIQPDGYNGHTARIYFCYDPDSKKTISVWRGGFYNSGMPDALDAPESNWLLHHHPTARNITMNK